MLKNFYREAQNAYLSKYNFQSGYQLLSSGSHAVTGKTRVHLPEACRHQETVNNLFSSVFFEVFYGLRNLVI